MTPDAYLGSRIIDRYMSPQAKRYKHFHALPNNDRDVERARPTGPETSGSEKTVTLRPEDISLGGQTMPVLDSIPDVQMTNAPGSNLIESDAIVIFVSFDPVLRGSVLTAIRYPFLGSRNIGNASTSAE